MARHGLGNISFRKHFFFNCHFTDYRKGVGVGGGGGGSNTHIKSPV